MPFRILPPALLGCLLALVAAAPASAYAPFQTGIHDPNSSGGDALRFDRMKDANASIARNAVLWSAHAPDGATKPAGFDARNPADPGYNWSTIDSFVRSAAARDVEPLLTVYSAPHWAEGDDDADRAKRFGDPHTYRPNAGHFADFMRAAAVRYSGTFADPGNPGQMLPRVKYWQIWNEPNFGQYLISQRKEDIPLVYSRLLDAAYDELKAVSKSNLVLTGGLGPYGNNGRATDVEPQVFMRSLMCLTGKGGRSLRDNPRCKYPKPKFDVWTQHPYTFGGTPTTRAGNPDSAAMGDMPEVRRTLDYARRVGNIGRGSNRLWATEFAWFSNPPGIRSGDGRELGLPLSRQAAYLSETAYRLWRLRFEALVWYGLGDQGGFPSGLYLGDGFENPKPVVEAFKLPFYADASSRGVLFWGLVSRGGRTTVRIERRAGSGWKRLKDVRTDGRGMFYTRVRGNKATYRARALNGGKPGLTSQPFAAR